MRPIVENIGTEVNVAHTCSLTRPLCFRIFRKYEILLAVWWVVHGVSLTCKEFVMVQAFFFFFRRQNNTFCLLSRHLSGVLNPLLPRYHLQYLSPGDF